MSNSYFRFRQFRIDQDRCAMKVSTDACIQGAWTPLRPGITRALDIGAGTCLLSLMLAQRSPGLHIDAVELDAAAAAQAAENVRNSPFSARIAVHAADARSFAAEAPYDLLICNPPFFRNSLRGPDAARNQARHDLSLKQEDLLVLMERHIAADGYTSVLWPQAEYDSWKTLAGAHGWQEAARLECRDRAGAEAGRITGIFSRQPGACAVTALTIREADGGYTAAFRTLLAPFYLYL